MSNATVVANEVINKEPFEQSLAIEMLANGFLDLKKKHKALYVAVNEMMASLGAHGQIEARDERVSAVMDVLHDIDGGVYDVEKIFK